MTYETPKFWNGYNSADVVKAFIASTEGDDHQKVRNAYYRKFNDGDKPHWGQMKAIAKRHNVEFDHYVGDEFMDDLLEATIQKVLENSA